MINHEHKGRHFLCIIAIVSLEDQRDGPYTMETPPPAKIHLIYIMLAKQQEVVA